MMISNKDALNRSDIVRWLKNTLLFSSPAIIAFLTAFQSGGDYKLAYGMGIQALISSAIDLLRKYSAGTENANIAPVVSVNPPVVPTAPTETVNTEVTSTPQS